MSCKLYYFEARGLCEPIRMIMKIGGEDFEDIRCPMTLPPPPQISPEVKAKCNWGQVPILEFDDGRKLCQSNAIGRYFAKKFNLVGSDDYEFALCDEYVDSARELLQSWLPVFIEQDELKKETLKKEIFDKVEGRFLKKFEEIIKANGGKRLVGKNLTWADIWLAHVMNNVEIVTGVKMAKNYPAIQSLTETVYAVPEIKAWVEKRPTTHF